MKYFVPDSHSIVSEAGNVEHQNISMTKNPRCDMLIFQFIWSHLLSELEFHFFVLICHFVIFFFFQINNFTIMCLYSLLFLFYHNRPFIENLLYLGNPFLV